MEDEESNPEIELQLATREQLGQELAARGAPYVLLIQLGNGDYEEQSNISYKKRVALYTALAITAEEFAKWEQEDNDKEEDNE